MLRNGWYTFPGILTWDDASGLATFEYDPRFKAKGWDLAPLQMPIYATTSTFVFPDLRKKAAPELDSFKGLPGLLADVLPDRYGNELINLWLARQGRPQNSMNPVEMLCFIGTRGMGALEFEPPVWKAKKNTFSVEIETLVDAAKKMLSKKEAFAANLDADANQALSDLIRIGTSAGGARPKAVIAYNEKTGEVRSGQTHAPKNFEHWLVKLDGVSDVQLGASKGYGRVEMAYYNMARACGIIMMPSRLLEENERAHFMTKRFDREGRSTKHHIQTFSALKHFDYNLVMSFSYEQLFQTMRELKLPYPDAEQMFRRMAFNVAARNCDDHTKNFSFRLKQDTKWELAPAYDVCHAYQPNHQWVSQHALSINGKRTNITKEDLLNIARSIHIKTAVEVIDEVNAAVAQWKNYADEVAVSPSLREQIAKTHIHLT
ncbi:MAG: toxin HipA [Prosthecochloris sp.]|uniref:type II toxin-antitoxin system HipA family toxin n=1 Tax=Prosthecochloris sp. TaxID=290513 RepID=UPI0013C6B116|nr:type II toxin-antitoxin system HipA family toxin [Prosthecochloris sp.]NEX13070.1 toxin HipA [Prosthecochloris sp.]